MNLTDLYILSAYEEQIRPPCGDTARSGLELEGQ